MDSGKWSQRMLQYASTNRSTKVSPRKLLKDEIQETIKIWSINEKDFQNKGE